MNERLTKLEAQLDGMSRTMEITLVSVFGVGGLLAAFLIGFSVYGLTRLDQLSDRTSAIPREIAAEMRDITKTLAESITAAKQTPPQVLLIPAPVQPEPPKP